MSAEYSVILLRMEAEDRLYVYGAYDGDLRAHEMAPVRARSIPIDVSIGSVCYERDDKAPNIPLPIGCTQILRGAF